MWLLAILTAFGLGSLPTALLVGWSAGVDVRTQGSGNPGAANTWRTAGRLAGSAVLLIDVLKGWVAAAGPSGLVDAPAAWVGAATGGAAVLGHVFSPFLKFRGGKGIATSAGVIAALAAPLLLVPVAVFVIVFALRRRASEASLAAAATLALTAVLQRALLSPGWPGNELIALTLAIALLAGWTHRENIRRIRRGDEPTLSL